MQRVQRKFGTLLKRSEDEADVGAILHEFNDAERFLASYIGHGETWRDSWRMILRTQLSIAEGFHVVYEPIGTDENVAHITTLTPEGHLVKASRLESAYAELQQELAEEVASIDARLLKPATEAKEGLKCLRKVIKKREDRKLDYERYHSRVEAASRKEIRSPKEDAALAHHESDLAAATNEYQMADEQIKRALPPILDAVSSLLPHLLTAQIMIQHSLTAQLYTAVYGYCQQQGMPVSPPSFEGVVSDWEAEFTPLRNEVESGIGMIANGKAIHQPMQLQDKKQGTVTGLGLRNAFAERRRGSGSGSHGSLPKPSMPSFLSRNSAVSEEEAPPVKPPRPGTGTPSRSYHEDEEEAPPTKPPRPGSSLTSNTLRIPHNKPTSSSSSPSHDVTPIDTPYMTPSRLSPSSDYFNAGRKPSAALVASSIAAKKKPPPPVPTKRVPSAQSQFVTALYDYAGQGARDLSFNEGDRIRVVKKTESTNDWWEGEIHGVSGSFPANYVEL
ncbi:hypothetical protein BDV97DRAFT_321519 [Delphinella strobiligena]|nr:hypothetical protein BDV97DRAFT_321519 [Delphinella strobiligena]